MLVGFIPWFYGRIWQRRENWRSICSAAIYRLGSICGRPTGEVGLASAIKRTLKRLRKFSAIWIGFGPPLTLRVGFRGLLGGRQARYSKSTLKFLNHP